MSSACFRQIGAPVSFQTFSNYETFLTGNVGGGLKWFSTRHFGVRGDYRFFMVRSKDTAPVFFGNENRYGHRVQAGLVFTY